MAKSTIEWTDATWNPVRGCTKVSPGCKHCYAERMAERLQAMGQRNYRNGFALTLQPHMLDLPLRWKKPQTIFVNSMSDLFHDEVPLSYIREVFAVMRKASWHRFQVLTKRSERLAELSSQLEWTPNIWMGVSVENRRHGLPRSIGRDHRRRRARDTSGSSAARGCGRRTGPRCRARRGTRDRSSSRRRGSART